jgi:tetratricopeptide (TPR) repeat protein
MGDEKLEGDGHPMKLVTGALALMGLLLVLSGCATHKKATLEKGTETSRQYLQLGIRHEANENYQQAIDHYNRAAKSGYHDEAYVYLGNTYQRMGAFPRAEKYYRIALDELPNHADLHHNLVYLYLSRETNLVEAETLAQRAIELNSESDHVNRYRSTLKKIRNLKNKKELVSFSQD